MCIQLFQLTLLDQSIKLQDKTARFVEFFMNEFIKLALPHPLVKIYDGHLDERNVRISSG